MSLLQPFAEATASLEEVLITDALQRRPSRAARHEAEASALASLAEAMTASPDTLLQTLAETAMDVCHADSAGVSILEWGDGGERVFRWRAAAGALASHVGEILPRDDSPCGEVIGRDQTLLFRFPDRHFAALRTIAPPVVETLLIPFHVEGRGAGTLWVAAHSDARQFGAEDAGVLRALSHFASIGYQLQDALDRARHASEAKSRFLATMSHDLRTPLTGVIGYADLLETQVVGPVNEQQAELLDRIQANSWHLVGIIDEILIASRVDSGQEEIQLTDCDVLDLIRGVVQTIETQLEDRELSVVIEPCQGDPVVRTDPGKVRRIVSNLVGNAVRYTDRGEIRITVEAGADEPVRVHVRDTGQGIPPEHHERIFEPFIRIDRASAEDDVGSGLGLAICRKLASLLGGSIVLESAPGAGSTFTLELPR